MKKYIHLFAYCLLSSVCFNADAIQNAPGHAPDDNILSQEADRAITELSALTQDEQAAETRSLCGSSKCGKRNCGQNDCCGCTPKNDCCTKLQCRRIITTLDVIESKVCLLTECEPIPLSQNDVVDTVLTIDQPGLYCLATDIDGSINIQASEVTLDLNCHAVTRSTSGIIAPIQGGINVDNVFVTNGIVDTNSIDGLGGVVFTDCTNIHLSHLTIRNSTLDGITATRVTNLFIEHVVSELNTNNGCLLNGCSNVLISDSLFSNNTSGAPDSGIGLLLTGVASDNVIATNCQFIGNNRRGVDVQLGGHLTLFNCFACGGISGYLSLDGTMEAFDCVADDNSNGFQGSTGTIFFERCLASNNTGFGFSAGAATSGTISQCVALNNGTGFDDDAGGTQYTSNYATGNGTNYNPAGPPFSPMPATAAGLSLWYNTFS